MPTPTARPALLALSVAAALTLTLAGCSSSSSGSTPGAGPSASTGQRDPRGGPRQPGVSGLIAARSGKTLQVQGTTEQTAVTWTGTTTFTKVEKAKASALRPGLCASVRAAGAPGGTGTSTTPVAATAVTLSATVGGACTSGFGGGARPSSTPGAAAPSGAPSRGPGGFGGRGADGLVTSVDGSTFVVQESRPGSAGEASVSVTTSTSTTWSEVARTSASAATVGRCATATGTTSGTGALTARTIRLSAPAADGTCGSFRTGRGPGQPGQDGQPGQGTTTHG